MDENLVRYAIQFKNRKDFEDRYQLFPSKEQRDRHFEFITKGQDVEALETVGKVQMKICVESEPA